MNFEKLEILNLNLIAEFKEAIKFDIIEFLDKAQEFDMSVDYFKFYKSLSSVYSSKIEGENIDFDSFFKYKFLNVEYKLEYTQKADDLFEAYEFIESNKISLQVLKQAHSLITRNLLPKSQRGLIRTNPMFVVNDEDKIEYVAANSSILNKELDKLFADIDKLVLRDIDIHEIFYFASLIHLVFVKLHPFQDGNGRLARLLEKWFLLQKLGTKATAIQLEKNYFSNLSSYYRNIKILGLEFEKLDYSKSLEFILMTIRGLENQITNHHN